MASLEMCFTLVRGEGMGSFGWYYIVLHLCLWRWWLDQVVRRVRRRTLSTGSCLTCPCRACSCSLSGAHTSWKWWADINNNKQEVTVKCPIFGLLYILVTSSTVFVEAGSSNGQILQQGVSRQCRGVRKSHQIQLHQWGEVRPGGGQQWCHHSIVKFRICCWLNCLFLAGDGNDQRTAGADGTHGERVQSRHPPHHLLGPAGLCSGHSERPPSTGHQEEEKCHPEVPTSFTL